MIDDSRVRAFFDKAERSLRWANSSLKEMRQYGQLAQMDDVERLFFAILFQLSMAREAIESACNVADLEDWRKAFIGECLSDPLLKYLWRARDSETHDAIIKWTGGSLAGQIEVIDAEKANAVPSAFLHYGNDASRAADLYEYIYGVRGTTALTKRIEENILPSKELMDKAGVRLVFVSATLVLNPFTYRVNGKKHSIQAPTSHLGKAIPHHADNVTESGIEYYRSKLEEARAVYSTKQQATPQAPSQ